VRCIEAGAAGTLGLRVPARLSFKGLALALCASATLVAGCAAPGPVPEVSREAPREAPQAVQPAAAPGRPPTPAAAVPAAVPAEPRDTSAPPIGREALAGPAPALRITATHPVYCAGVAHPAQPVDSPAGWFTAHQQMDMAMRPDLTVEVLPDEAAAA
jgi:hypothetical protein